MSRNDNSKKKSSWGGYRDNAGRKLGSMNKATKDQKLAEEYFKQRVLQSIDKLVNSQMSLASGIQMLFRIDIEKDAKGKETKSKPILVTSQEEIENYLSGDYNDNKQNYYFLTTERPENKAIDSMIDRVFGKAPQKLQLSTPDGQPIVVLCDPASLSRYNKDADVPASEPKTS